MFHRVKVAKGHWSLSGIFSECPGKKCDNAEHILKEIDASFIYI
jgi:hypothetical protein